LSISYFSLTAGGSLLALKLQEHFGGEASLPRCHSLGCGHCSPFDDLAQALTERFRADGSADALVCVMAAGIVFRILGPELRSKAEDPAVVVVDEDGRFAVPMLGGHAAGANKLARDIAGFLGGKAVLTTASDVRGLVAPDQMAARLGLKVTDPEQLRRVTALLVDGGAVCVEAPVNPGCEDYGWVRPGGSLEGYQGRLLVTHRSGSPDEGIPTARLVPPVVAAGVGCRRGAAAADITAAIRSTCATHGVDTLAVGCLASIDAKRDEAGLLEAAEQMGVPLRWYGAGQLGELGRPGSGFVEEAVGTPAVAEPAALLAAGEGAQLISGKEAYGGVTVALALGQWRPGPRREDAAVADAPEPASASETARGATPTGGVTVVGTGAGTGELLTAQARTAIRSADRVVGYRTYVEQVKEIFPETAAEEERYISGSMGRERERCRQALDLAAQGHRVALISSGDPGVYGMAGLLLEMAAGFDGGIPVSIAPGVTAAQLAAARLGAPLMNDYITLSLSDLLTPREEVLRRVEAAAASGMVICLYNPASRKRRPLFEQASAIIGRHRPGGTIAGWVRNAGGPGEETVITTLAELAEADIDMRTVVIVGNSRTRIIDGRMVTLRGYERKEKKGTSVSRRAQGEGEKGS
jgi:cobalt-precorrin 5A hydrolase/precorrin-3B C17-methyltransferase